MSRPAPIPDFRKGMIRKKLKSVHKVILVMSGKGGVGKSVVSATLAALLGERGFRVGLLDADLFGPSSALLLDARGPPAEGRKGLVPPSAGGVKVMSLDLFAPGKPFPLTGEGARQVLLELLALTDWGRLDHLVVDMPPATSDIMMTLTSLPKKSVEVVAVTTADRLSVSVVHRVMEMLTAGKIRVAGVLVNMVNGEGDAVGPRKLAEEFGVPVLVELPYDEGLARAVEAGGSKELVGTKFARILGQLTKVLSSTRVHGADRPEVQRFHRRSSRERGAVAHHYSGES